MKEYCRTGQATDDNMALHIACWIPKAINTHSGCVNAYCFFTATMVGRTCLYVTLHVHSLSCCTLFDLFFYYLFVFY